MNVQSVPVAAENVNAAVDKITFLKSQKAQGKRIRFKDGAWQKKQLKLEFKWQAEVADISDLKHFGKMLAKGSDNRKCIIVHGVPKDGVDLNDLRRIGDNFEDAAHRFILIDDDGLETMETDGPAVAMAARARLPAVFHDARCLWNLTSGHALTPGKARVRLVFWTNRPITLAETEALLSPVADIIDMSIYRTVQPIFLGVTVLGAPDPVGQRWGLIDGEPSVELPDLIPHALKASAMERTKSVAPGCVEDAPHMIDEFVREIEVRSERDRLDDGRRNVIRNTANDGFDLGLSRDTVCAIEWAWFDRDLSGSKGELREHLEGIGVDDANALSARVLAAGEKIGEGWDAGKEALDATHIEDQIESALSSRHTAVGSRFMTPEALDAERRKKGPARGDAFGAVEQDETSSFAKIEAIRWAVDNGVTIDAGMLYDLRCALEDDGVKAETAGVMCRALASYGPGEYALGDTDDLLSKMADKARKAISKPEAPKKGRLAFTLFDEAADAAFAEVERQLVKDMLDLGSMSVLYGKSNAGKSFIALLLAFHIALGTEFAGREVEQGLVVYIVAEGGRRFDRRLAALRAKYPEAKNPPLAIVKSSVDLHGNDADVKEITRIVSEAEAATGKKALLVIVDTLARAMGAGSENEARDMNALVTNGDKVRQRTGAHLMYIHHSGKDRAKGARGHSSLRAATDTEIEVVADGAGLRSMTVTKQRDMETGDVFNFRLVDMQLGTDAEGNPRKSAVAKIVDTTSLQAKRAKPPTGRKLSPGEAEAFDVIKRLAQGSDGPIAMAAIRDAMNEGRKADAGDGEFAEVKGNYLRKLRASLIAVGLIREGEPGHVLLAAADDASMRFGMVDDEEGEALAA